MGKNSTFTLEDTLKMKGIAIIFLICFHSFSSEGRLSGYEINFYPLPKELAMYISETMYICVGVFVFISAYGMTFSAKKIDSSFLLNREQMLFDSLRRYTRLLLGFLVIFFPGLIISVLYFPETVRYGLNTGADTMYFGNMFLDMIGLGHLFGIPKLNGSWWYMSLAICLIFLMPLFLQLYRKFGLLILGLFLIIPYYTFNEIDVMQMWLFAIPLGIISADKNLLGKIKDIKFLESKKLTKVIKFLVFTMILLLIIYVRKSPWGSLVYVRYLLNGLLPLAVIVYSYEFIFNIPIIRGILKFLGRHSLNIFLVHTFIRYNWFNDFTYSLTYAFLIVIFLLVSSSIISVVIEYIKTVIKLDSFANFIEKRIITKIIN